MGFQTFLVPFSSSYSWQETLFGSTFPKRSHILAALGFCGGLSRGTMTEPSTGTSSSNGYPPHSVKIPVRVKTSTGQLDVDVRDRSCFHDGDSRRPGASFGVRTHASRVGAEDRVRRRRVCRRSAGWKMRLFWKGGPRRCRPASSLKAWAHDGNTGDREKGAPAHVNARHCSKRWDRKSAVDFPPGKWKKGVARKGGWRTGIGILGCYIEVIKRDEFKIPKVSVVEKDERLRSICIGSRREKDKGEEDGSGRISIFFFGSIFRNWIELNPVWGWRKSRVNQQQGKNSRNDGGAERRELCSCLVRSQYRSSSTTLTTTQRKKKTRSM